MKSMLETKQGWQAQLTPGARRFHFIREGMALCRAVGFYRGDLVPDVGNGPKGNEDCTKCFRIVRGEKA